MYIRPQDVTALSFDIWGTLLKGNNAFSRPRLRLIFDTLGHTQVPTEELRTAYLAADRFCNDEAERTGHDYGMADRVRLMYEALGIDKTVPDAATVADLQQRVGELRLRPEYMPSLIEPDLIETLNALRMQDLTLGLLSNTGIDSEVVMQDVLRKLGIWSLFEVTVFSSAHGLAKPNPILFHDMAEQLGVKPHQVLHVGDNRNADCRAVEAGLHAVLYAPKGEPEGNQYPCITSMRELVG